MTTTFDIAEYLDNKEVIAEYLSQRPDRCRRLSPANAGRRGETEDMVGHDTGILDADELPANRAVDFGIVPLFRLLKDSLQCLERSVNERNEADHAQQHLPTEGRLRFPQLQEYFVRLEPVRQGNLGRRRFECG